MHLGQYIIGLEGKDFRPTELEFPSGLSTVIISDALPDKEITGDFHVRFSDKKYSTWSAFFPFLCLAREMKNLFENKGIEESKLYFYIASRNDLNSNCTAQEVRMMGEIGLPVVYNIYRDDADSLCSGESLFLLQDCWASDEVKTTWVDFILDRDFLTAAELLKDSLAGEDELFSKPQKHIWLAYCECWIRSGWDEGEFKPDFAKFDSLLSELNSHEAYIEVLKIMTFWEEYDYALKTAAKALSLFGNSLDIILESGRCYEAAMGTDYAVSFLTDQAKSLDPDMKFKVGMEIACVYNRNRMFDECVEAVKSSFRNSIYRKYSRADEV